MEADLMGWVLEFDQFPKGCTGNLAVQKALHIVEYCVVRYWLLCCVIIMRRPCAASCYEIQSPGNQQNIRAAVNRYTGRAGSSFDIYHRRELRRRGAFRQNFSYYSDSNAHNITP